MTHEQLEQHRCYAIRELCAFAGKTVAEADAFFLQSLTPAEVQHKLKKEPVRVCFELGFEEREKLKLIPVPRRNVAIALNNNGGTE